MSKKFLIALLTIASAMCVCVGISACETDNHTHNFTYVSEVAATCTTDGNIEYWYCSGCSKYYSDENGTNEITTTVITSKLGYSFTTYISDGNATCTEDGTKTADCDHEGCTVTDTITDEGSKLGHSFTTYVSDGNATCTEDGTKTAACDHEGCTVTDTVTDEGSKLGHSFTTYVSDGNATCTEDGTKTATCDHEGCTVTDTITDEGSKLGHSFTTYVSDGNATCTEDGTKTATCDHDGCDVTDTITDEGSKLGHSFTTYVSDGNAICTEDGTKTAVCEHEGCTVTDTITDEGSKLGHSFSNYVSDGNATCTEDGTKTAVCEHEGCTVTDTITDEGSKLGHSFTNYVSDGNATCTDDGTKTAVCDHDGCTVTDTITDEGSKLGHSFTTYISDGNATCTEDGTKTAVCDHDGCTVTDTITDEGSKLGHTLTKTDAVSATCTEDGNIDYWYCSICKKYYSDADASTEIELSETVIKALGHDYVISWSWTGVTSAEATFTCENDSTHTHMLSATITNSITTEVTCTTAGIRTYTAAVTFEGKTYTAKQNEAIAATGHVWDNGEITIEPTCTEDGVKTFTCTVCHDSYPETVKATGHNYVFSYWTWAGYQSAVAYFVCENDNTHTYEVKAIIANEVTTQSTCISTGIKTYTATVTFENNVYTSIKTEVLSYSEHVIMHKDYTAATCTTDGNNEYWYCSVCGSVFSDDAGENEISSSDVIISATGHTVSSITTYNDTYHYYYCDVCKEYIEEVHTIGSDLKCTLCEYSTSYSNYLEFTTAADLYAYGETEYGKTGYVVTGIGECTDTAIVIPDTYLGLPVVGISYNVFNDNNIISITIPNSIIYIGNGAFSSCGITSITIPDSVTSIGGDAFGCCYSLESVYIGKGLTWLSSIIFRDCPSLKTIIIDEDNIYLKSVNNVVYSKDGTELIYYPLALSNTSYTVLDGVEEISSYAFCGYTTTKLKKVTLPDTVTHINGYAFAYLTITSIDLGNGLTFIGDEAFSNCSALTSITLPDSVSFIGGHAFENCNFSTINIPSSLTSIGNYAFASLSSLTNIIIPTSVTSIGEAAFSCCYSLESIIIPDSVTTISYGAFSYCISLNNIIIPNKVTIINEGAFSYCTSLTSVYYTGTADEWDAISINESFNTCLTSAIIYYYSKIQPTEEGNYWHYVDGEVVIWTVEE